MQYELPKGAQGFIQNSVHLTVGIPNYLGLLNVSFDRNLQITNVKLRYLYHSLLSADTFLGTLQLPVMVDKVSGRAHVKSAAPTYWLKIVFVSFSDAGISKRKTSTSQLINHF